MTDYERGFADGYKSVQPQWVSVKERLPEEDGDYFTISELQVDTPAGPKGTISIDIDETWSDGKWWQDSEESWKVLYWAKPIRLDVPEALSDRPRLGMI